MDLRRLLLLSTILGSLAVRSESADLYYGLTGFLSQGLADPNTGLTSFPTLMIPMGGRYEGMGTAYSAVAADSGYLESNPAGSATLAYTELSFLHHAWIADSSLEGVVYTVRFDDLGIGIGGKFLYVPFTAYDEWGARDGKGYITETVGTFNVGYNFFPSYRFSGISAGANLKVAWRNVPAAIYPDQSALTALLDLGLLTRFDFLKPYISRSRNFAVGVVLKNFGLPALGGLSWPGEPLPTQLTAGIAWSPIRPLILALDFNLPVSLDPSVPAQRWDVATGATLQVTPFLSIQGGVHVKGDNPRVAVGSTIDMKGISFILNYNLDLSGRLNPLDKFSVEVKLNLGDKGRLAAQQKVADLYLNGVDAYIRGDLEGAMGYWESALAIDPGFSPVRDLIDSTREELELRREMEQKLRPDRVY